MLVFKTKVSKDSTVSLPKNIECHHWSGVRLNRLEIMIKLRRHNNDLQTSISADRRGNFNFEDEKGPISYMLKMFKWHRDNGAPA